MNELSFDPGALELPSGHFINGEIRRFAESSIDVVCPSDGRRLGEVPDANEDLIDEAVTSACLAWQSSGWASCPPRERGRVLRRWADLIDGDAVRLAQLEAVSSTRPVAHAYADDVPFMTAEAIRFFGELARQARRWRPFAATSRESLGLGSHPSPMASSALSLRGTFPCRCAHGSADRRERPGMPSC